MECVPGEGAVHIDMTTEDLGYYVNLVDKSRGEVWQETPTSKEVLL